MSNYLEHLVEELIEYKQRNEQREQIVLNQKRDSLTSRTQFCFYKFNADTILLALSMDKGDIRDDMIPPCSFLPVTTLHEIGPRFYETASYYKRKFSKKNDVTVHILTNLSEDFEGFALLFHDVMEDVEITKDRVLERVDTLLDFYKSAEEETKDKLQTKLEILSNFLRKQDEK